MDQQIKLDNKNSNEENYEKLDKIRFQTSIFNYVERKKRELSCFSALNQNQKSFPDKNLPNSSNLINRNTALNFYQLNSQGQSELLPTFRNNWANQRQNFSVVRNKLRGYKSSLSDWRNLYEQRDCIAEKQEMRKTSPDKLAVTDRLFYPSKKMTSPNFRKEEAKIISDRGEESNQNRDLQATVNISQKQFISDQNYFHMYYRSSNPVFNEDGEGKRIVKYLKENKHKRQSSHGLRLMNEALSYPQPAKDVYIVPYQTQQLKKDILDLPKKKQSFNSTSPNFLFPNRIKNPADKQMSQQLRKMSQQLRKISKILPSKKENKDQQIEGLNPEFIIPSKSKIMNEKKTINLSELCIKNLDSNQKKPKILQIHLKLFKPRRNKIEKGILNLKNHIIEEKDRDFFGSLRRIPV